MTDPERRGRGNRGGERREFGQRLKLTAQAAGYTSETLAEVLGVTPGAIRMWWIGKNEPSRDTLIRYAEVTKVSLGYLMIGDAAPMGPSGTMMEWLLRVRALTEKGLSPAEAVDRVTGPKPTGVIDGWDLTPEERELLDGPPDAVNQTLSPGAPDLQRLLERLSPEDQQMVRQLIARLLARERAGGEER